MTAASQTFSPFPWPMPPGFAPSFEAWMNRMGKLPKVMEIAQSVRVGSTPREVTYREDKLQVLRYESDVEKRYRTPLVVAFALVNRPYILDLMPHKSVIRHFLNSGFDVYLIDWGVPTPGDRHLSVKDYVERYMHNVVNHVREQTGADRVTLLGYCMGGTLTAMYTALHQELVQNLILMAAPIDFSKRESLLSVWSDARYFDVDKAIETFGNMPPEWLQGSFLMLKPISNLIEKYLTFYEKMDDEKFLRDYFAMETWINDNIPVAGETFRQFVKYLFQQNQLVDGKFHVGQKRVDLRKITCPVLNLIATEDHLVPPGQSLPFNNLISSTDRMVNMFEAGHIGLSVGGKAQRELWPKVCNWLAMRSERVDGTYEDAEAFARAAARPEGGPVRFEDVIQDEL